MGVTKLLSFSVSILSDIKKRNSRNVVGVPYEVYFPEPLIEGDKGSRLKE